jgi:hypothetical protein
LKAPRYKTPDDEHGNRHTKANNGGIITTEKAMQVCAPTVCAECPFRKDSTPGYLGGYTPEMYMEVTFSPASIACHKYLNRGLELDQQKHCTGLSAFRAQNGHIASVIVPMAVPGKEEFVVNMVTPTLAHESTQKIGSHPDLILETPEDFIEHHKKGQL